MITTRLYQSPIREPRNLQGLIGAPENMLPMLLRPQLIPSPPPRHFSAFHAVRKSGLLYFPSLRGLAFLSLDLALQLRPTHLPIRIANAQRLRGRILPQWLKIRQSSRVGPILEFLIPSPRPLMLLLPRLRASRRQVRHYCGRTRQPLQCLLGHHRLR